MATGDEAAAAGLVVVPTTEPLNNGATRHNQRGDELARVIARLAAVELTALAPPMFSAQRSNRGQQIGRDVWSQIVAASLATPLLNTGFASYVAGALEIKKAGVYQVGAHVQFYGQGFTTVGVQLVKNSYPQGATSDPRVDTIDMLAKDEWGGGGGAVPAATATAYNLVRLAVGDVVRLFVLQRNAANATVEAGKVPGDLTWSMVWVNN